MGAVLLQLSSQAEHVLLEHILGMLPESILTPTVESCPQQGHSRWLSAAKTSPMAADCAFLIRRLTALYADSCHVASSIFILLQSVIWKLGWHSYRSVTRKGQLCLQGLRGQDPVACRSFKMIRTIHSSGRQVTDG